MLYRVEQLVEGAWRLVKETYEWVAPGRGSFRFINVVTGIAEYEIHT